MQLLLIVCITSSVSKQNFVKEFELLSFFAKGSSNITKPYIYFTNDKRWSLSIDSKCWSYTFFYLLDIFLFICLCDILHLFVVWSAFIIPSNGIFTLGFSWYAIRIQKILILLFSFKFPLYIYFTEFVKNCLLYTIFSINCKHCFVYN